MSRRKRRKAQLAWINTYLNIDDTYFKNANHSSIKELLNVYNYIKQPNWKLIGKENEKIKYTPNKK